MNKSSRFSNHNFHGDGPMVSFMFIIIIFK